jgi:hypothetical protein
MQSLDGLRRIAQCGHLALSGSVARIPAVLRLEDSNDRAIRERGLAQGCRIAMGTAETPAQLPARTGTLLHLVSLPSHSNTPPTEGANAAC